MSERKIFKLNDEFIQQIQNLVSLCIMSGTNITDHMRQMRLEESGDSVSTLVLTPEYLEYYTKIVSKLKEELQAQMEVAQKTEATTN